MFLNSALQQFSTLFADSVLPYFTNDATPLAIAILPVHLLCACIRVSLQMGSLPCEVIAGLRWLSDEINGKRPDNRTILPLCSSQCFSILQSRFVECDYEAAVMMLLQGPLRRETRCISSVLSDPSPVLFHQSDADPDLPCTRCVTRTLSSSECGQLAVSQLLYAVDEPRLAPIAAAPEPPAQESAGGRRGELAAATDGGGVGVGSRTQPERTRASRTAARARFSRRYRRPLGES